MLNVTKGYLFTLAKEMVAEMFFLAMATELTSVDGDGVGMLLAAHTLIHLAVSNLIPSSKGTKKHLATCLWRRRRWLRISVRIFAAASRHNDWKIVSLLLKS